MPQSFSDFVKQKQTTQGNQSQSGFAQFVMQKKSAPEPTPANEPEKKPGLLKSIARGLISPLVTTGTRIGQAIAAPFNPSAGEQSVTTHIPVLGDFTIAPQKPGLKGVKQAVGEEAQTAALGIKNPVTGAATAAFGQSLEKDNSLKKTALNTGIGALTGLAALGLGKGISKISNPVSKPLTESAERSYSQALGATTKTNKQLSDKVVPQLIDRGIKATSRTGLLNKAEQGVAKSADALEEAYDKLSPGTRVNTKPIFDSLQKLKMNYVVKGTDKVADEGAYKAVENMQRKLLEISDENVSVESFRSFRQILDKATKRAGKSFAMTDSDSVVTEARKATANAIRNQLAAEHPNIAKLNAEFNFWSNVQKVMGDTIQRTKSQNPLSNQIATEGGAILGATLKGTIGKAILGAASLRLLKNAVQSTGWRTTSALVKASIAKAIEKGDIAKLDSILQKIITANQNQK